MLDINKKIEQAESNLNFHQKQLDWHQERCLKWRSDLDDLEKQKKEEAESNSRAFHRLVTNVLYPDTPDHIIDECYEKEQGKWKEATMVFMACLKAKGKTSTINKVIPDLQKYMMMKGIGRRGSWDLGFEHNELFGIIQMVIFSFFEHIEDPI